MSEEPEQHKPRPSISAKPIIILVLLIGAFVVALYMAFHEEPEYSGPAWVKQAPVNHNGLPAQLSSTPSGSPEVLAYNPSTVYGLPEKERNVFSDEKAQARSSNPPVMRATPRRQQVEQSLDEDEEVFTTSSNSNTGLSRRSGVKSVELLGERDTSAHQARGESVRASSNSNIGLYSRKSGDSRVELHREPQSVRRADLFNEQPRSITILSYPDVKYSKLAEALQEPKFEIKIRTTKRLKIENDSIESGEYTLKPKLEGTSWYLLFTRADSTSAQLPLKLEAATKDNEKLSVVINEIEKMALIRIHLGRDELTGWFAKE